MTRGMVMKKLILIAGVFALGACQSEPAEEPMAEETEAPVEEVALAVDGLPAVGTYQVVSVDGTEGTYVAAEDGTYTWTVGDTVETGTWSVEPPDRWCNLPEGAEEAACFTESISEDGVWSSVDADGNPDAASIVRVED
jgi:hypothetical protein